MTWGGDRQSVRSNKARSRRGRPEAATQVTLDQMRALKVMLQPPAEGEKAEKEANADVYDSSFVVRDYLADLQVRATPCHLLSSSVLSGLRI